MTEIEKPSLFGVKHSNRDFSDRDAWGKNQFNSSFPAALSAYLAHKNLENVYIKLDENLETYHDRIRTENLYGLPSASENLFYSFESQFLPFQKFLIGNIPRVDLVNKAFALSGGVTRSFMQGEILRQPRITKEEIKNIILNGGQNLLSPERRFDAIVFNSPDLFD